MSLHLMMYCILSESLNWTMIQPNALSEQFLDYQMSNHHEIPNSGRMFVNIMMKKTNTTEYFIGIYR